jgi:YVTN family beta-propeller protein
MLQFAIATLLALQAASGSPNPAPPGTAPQSSAPQGVVPGTGAAPQAPGSTAAPSSDTTSEAPPAAPATPGRAPRTTPTPGPRPSPTPAMKAGGDMLLVVNKTDSTVSILDAATGKLRTTVAVEAGPHEVEVLADGKTAAVSSYGTKAEAGHMVTVVDLTSAKVVSRIDIGPGSRPHGLKALPDGRLLVTAEGTREIVIVDPQAAKVTARIATGRDISHMVTASPDGRRAYVTSLAGGSVTVIDLVTGKVVKDIPTGKGAEGLDATPDGREVWVANREANTITVIDVKTLAPVFTINATEFPIRVKITPDGRRAVVTFTGSGDVGVYDTATRVQAARIPIGREAVAGAETRVFQKRFGTSPAPVGLLIAPDGGRAFVSAGHADVVAVIDLQKLRVDDAWTAGKEPDGLAGRFGAKAEETKAPAPGRRVTARKPN